MNADKIIERLEKLRGAARQSEERDRYGDMYEPGAMVIGLSDLDAAINDIRGMLQSQQTAVRADDRWRALLAEMRSYNDFEARCADRIESLLAEPVTVWNDANAVPNNARDVLVRYQYADGTWRNCVSWWNGAHWVGKDDRVKFWCELPKPPDAPGGTDAK